MNVFAMEAFQFGKRDRNLESENLRFLTSFVCQFFGFRFGKQKRFELLGGFAALGNFVACFFCSMSMFHGMFGIVLDGKTRRRLAAVCFFVLAALRSVPRWSENELED